MTTVRSVRVHSISEADIAGRITARWLVVTDIHNGRTMQFSLPQMPSRTAGRQWPKDGRPVLSLPTPHRAGGRP